MEVIGVKFDKSPKIYYFAAGEHEYTADCGVIVETSRGVEFARVAMLPHTVEEDKIVQPLKTIMRVATEQDEAAVAKHAKLRPGALRSVKEKVEKSGLKMKVVDVDYTLDGSKLIVYFTADGRVDFRDLVRELASSFRLRIELRQIGARDECRMMGGIAPCGRACCCSDYISDFAHVTIKMAKNQNLSLNPAKISGLCGRLMCCLSYENAHYAETNKRMPKVGSPVKLADGREGIAVAIHQLKETVRVKIEVKDGVEFEDVPLADIRFKGKGMQEEDLQTEKIDEELKELLD